MPGHAVPTKAAPTVADTFVVITDSMAAAALARGTFLPSIRRHFDRGVVLTRGDVVCFRYPRYTVVLTGRPGDATLDLLARSRTTDSTGHPMDACATDSLAGDYVLREQEGVMGLRGDTLWAEAGDALSEVTLHDLAHRKPLLTISNYEIAEWPSNDLVKLWIGTAAAPRAECPEVPAANSPIRDSLYLLHIVSLRLEALGPIRCRAMQ